MSEEYPSIDRLAREAFSDAMAGQLGDIWRKQFAEAKVCERCKRNKPDLIAAYGPFIAVCRPCMDWMDADKAASLAKLEEDARDDYRTYYRNS